MFLSINSHSQTTIITHGWCDPNLIDALYGWMLDMGNAIKDRVGGKIMIYNRTTGNFDYYSGSGNHAILLFDWRVESTLNVIGYSEACGNALYAALMKGYLQGDFNLTDLHFIAHSRGTVVQGEAAERLLVNGVPVEHVTNIDAHDWGVVNQICTDFDANPTLNQMGVICWQGVTFSDSYWQDNPVPLIGRKVDGTYSIYLGGVLQGFSHVTIPDWYTGTVTDINSSEGFRYSKLAGGIPVRPAPNYGSPIVPLLDYDYDGIVNGDFERGVDNFSYIPGWSYHGGVGTAFMENGHLKLNSGGYNRISNRFYVPSNAGNITFDYKVQSASSGTPPATDKLVIKIGNIIVSDQTYLNNTTAGFNHITLDVRNFRNTVQTIEFLVEDPSGGHSSISSETWIDNVKFEIVINLGRDTTMCMGDTLILDAGSMGKLNGVTYLWSTGSNARQIAVTSPGMYWVLGNKNGRMVRDTIVVNFTTNPVVDLGNDVTLCQGEQLILDAGNQNCSYTWNTFSVARHLPVLSTGFYQVTVTNHACPPVSDSVIVNFIPKPAFTLRNDTMICHPVIIGVNRDTINASSSFFNGITNCITATTQLTVSNNFCVEAWVKPESTHEIDRESNTGTDGLSGQKYILYPAQGNTTWGAGHAGMGISAGTNGISIYEYADSYFAPVLVWQGNISGWTHIAVVYSNKQPYLYVNGKLVKKGFQSSITYIHPSATLGGGDFGHFFGSVDEFRIWDHVRWQTMIYLDMYKRMTGTEIGLLLNWSMDEHSTNYVYDASPNMNNGRISGATISSFRPFYTAYDNCTYSWNNGAGTAAILTTPRTSFNYILTVTNADGCFSTDTVFIRYNDTLCEDFGINRFSREVGLYPNPANNTLHILLPVYRENLKISVYDILGKCVLHSDAAKFNDSFDLDVSSLNIGMYILGFESEQVNFKKPFVIEK